MLSPLEADALLGDLTRLCESGYGFLLITHKLREVEDFADREDEDREEQRVALGHVHQAGGDEDRHQGRDDREHREDGLALHGWNL